MEGRIMLSPKITAAIAATAALTLIAGCSRTDNEPGPGGVTVSEAKALDDAAAMLESRDNVSASETGTADNKKTGQ